MQKEDPLIHEKLWCKDYILIIFAAAGIAFCNYSFFAPFPIYAQKISGTAAYAGFMTGIFTLVALATRPISGILIEKIGRKKSLIIGALLCTIACLLYNFASVIILLILLRALHGIGFGIHSTSAGAVSADIIPQSRLMEGLGYFGLYAPIVSAVAPGIALAITGNGQVEKFRTLFILGAAVSLVSMLIDCFITYESKKKIQENFEAKEENNNLISRQDNTVLVQNLPKTFLGFEYALFLPSVVVIFIFLGQSSVTSFLALYAIENNLGNIGAFFAIAAIGTFVSRLFLGKAADKYGPNIIVIPALIVNSICYAIIPFTHSIFSLLLIAIPFGLAQGTISPVFNGLIIIRCSPERRGTATAAYFSAIDIGLGVGSIFFGVIAAAFGYAFLFYGACGFSLMAMMIYILTLVEK